ARAALAVRGAPEGVRVGDRGELLARRDETEAVADALELRGGVPQQLLVSDEDPARRIVGFERVLDDLGAVAPHARLPAHERHPRALGERVGPLLERPRVAAGGTQPRR